jgi:hypothetical protein
MFAFTCNKDWVAQTVNVDVSLGYYDQTRKTVVVPNKQWYTLGLIDHKAWKETGKEWDHGQMEPNTFRLDITLTRSNLPNAPGPPANVDELIAESRIDAE